jgi:hypothetical protein
MIMSYASFVPRRLWLSVGLFLALICLLAGLFWSEIEAPRRRMAQVDATILTIQSDPVLLQAVRDQNQLLAEMDQTGINALDAHWVAEKTRGGGPLIADYLSRPTSQKLREYLAKGRGIVRHAILMDNKGRNVAIAAPTSDYFQGDEAKWLETFARPSLTRHISDLEQGHEGAFVARWVSAPIWDAARNEPLGAIALEYDVNAKMSFFAQ